MLQGRKVSFFAVLLSQNWSHLTSWKWRRSTRAYRCFCLSRSLSFSCLLCYCCWCCRRWLFNMHIHAYDKIRICYGPTTIKPCSSPGVRSESWPKMWCMSSEVLLTLGYPRAEHSNHTLPPPGKDRHRAVWTPISPGMSCEFGFKARILKTTASYLDASLQVETTLCIGYETRNIFCGVWDEMTG